MPPLEETIVEKDDRENEEVREKSDSIVLGRSIAREERETSSRRIGEFAD